MTEDCTVCGATLERFEQSIFTMCPRCRKTWDDGFLAGLKARVCDVDSINGMERLMRNIAPYYAPGVDGE